MTKCLLFPHGGSGNHGCEAIVRTTYEILKGNEIFLFSERPDEDQNYLKDINISILSPHQRIRKFTLPYFRAKFNQLIKHQNNAIDVESFSPILKHCDSNTVLLSIGGDNYCYGDNEYILLVNQEARKRGAKTILWGASVDEQTITEKMKNDLTKYDLIIARESISYRYLCSINHNTVMLPDPAFFLRTGKGVFSEDLFKKEVIGINISPMIISYETTESIAYLNYVFLIDRIIKNTDYNIALIPHVIWESNDDRKPLKELYEQFNDTGRVFLIDDQNCQQLKYIIGRCSFFIGARTHSTIAAYSSCVPTFVVGYSVKALGIAKDLLGSTEDYVLPVQSLKTEHDLYDRCLNALDNKEKIRKALSDKKQMYQAIHSEYLQEFQNCVARDNDE